MGVLGMYVKWCSYMDHSSLQVPQHLTEQLHPAPAAASIAAIGTIASSPSNGADADRMVSITQSVA